MSVTHIVLHNSTSCTIKGKLTWPSVLWFGQDGEHVHLMGKNKSRELNIGDGSFTKHNPLVERLISESCKVTVNRDGESIP